MNNHEKQQSIGNREINDQQKSSDDSSSVTDAVSGDSSVRRNGNGNGNGIADRLTNLFVGDGDNDDDLLIQRSTQGTVMQWLQALDMQVMGACRADERLKPLLKLNVSSGVAENRLLSHLSQHFEPSEVGLLARCLCVPLVSVRVGKIEKQGDLLVPNSARGNLTLSLLPTSDLRISFLGDDSHVDRIATLRSITDCTSVTIDGISADSSGRSFVIRVPNVEPFYFWCSERSRPLGNELLDKMKNLLEKKPSLADLTGISNSRLECFVSRLRTYLVGSNTPSTISTTSLVVGETSKTSQSKSARSRSCSIQGSLSPRPNSFKETPPRNLASLKNIVKENFSLLKPGSFSRVENLENLSASSPTSSNTSTLNQSLKAEISGPTIDTTFPLIIGLEVGLAEKTMDMPSVSPTPPVPSFSPYYCWCPPVTPNLDYTVTPSQIIPVSIGESFTLPPLPSLLAPNQTLNPAEIPPFLPDPLVRFPMSLPTSQQIPIFTPLMTDSIVHIPVMDICSSGQAYLVSASPAMNVTIPPLMTPLIQETSSIAEKSARDTLRLLISGSSQLPSVLVNVDGNQNVLASGSRGLYGGATDVNHAIANSIAAMGLVSLSDRSSIMRRCIDQGDLVDLLGETVDSGGTCANDNDGNDSNLSDSGDGKRQ